MTTNPNLTPQWTPDDDELLESAAPDPSLARLSAAPEEEASHHRLALVDQLLRHAPLVKPSAEFAEKVIEALRRRASKPFDRNIATGIILGLGSISALITFTLVGLLSLLVAILLNWTSAYQNLVVLAGNVRLVLLDINQWLDSRLNTSPLVLVLSLGALPLSLLWWWWIRLIGRGNHKEV
jgi:hypothetical protein